MSRVAKMAALAVATLSEVALLIYSSILCAQTGSFLAVAASVLCVASVMALWAYGACMLMPQSRCDEVWTRVDQSRAAREEAAGLLDDSIHGTVTCEECDAQQLPRSHHCDVCGTCVLRFEAHSKWVGRCVALENLKLYVLAHFYFAVLCTTVLALHMSRFAANPFFAGPFWLLLFATSSFVATTHAIVALRHVALHLWLLAFGMTVHEWRTNTKEEKTFNCGTKSNFESAFGKDGWLALLPIPARFDPLRYEWFVPHEQTHLLTSVEEEEEDRISDSRRQCVLSTTSHNVSVVGSSINEASFVAGAPLISDTPRSQDKTPMWLQDSKRFPKHVGAFLNPEDSDDRE